jgi:apolipoprotein N-acyltransferase
MIIKKNSPVIRSVFLAVMAGSLMTISFPKLHLWPLAFIALIPLMIACHNQRARHAFFLGSIFGISFFLTLIYWLIPTLDQYGGLPPALAVCILFLLCVYLSLYPAICCLIINRVRFIPCLLPFFYACLWVGLEYIRTYAFTGFSWGVLGYSQSASLRLIQIADITGVYGVSFVIVLVNATLANLWVSRKKMLRHRLVPVVYTLAICITILLYGHQKQQAVQSLIPSLPTATIGIVQGNIDQNNKWNKTVKQQTIEKYTRLSQQLAEAGCDLIVWPETALPFYYGLDKLMSFRLDQFIRSADTFFLIGSPAFKQTDQTISYYNRAYLFGPDTSIWGTYDKHHLVPFGEYVPFGKYLQFLGKIIAQAGDFSPGPPHFFPLPFKDFNTGVLICFEILFPDISTAFVKNGATFLTTITNDAWFGTTSAPEQHLAIAVFRAVENRRALIRAANTGISGYIDPTGRPSGTTALFSDAAIFQELPAVSFMSIYTRYSDLFVWITMVAFCLGFMIKRFHSDR